MFVARYSMAMYRFSKASLAPKETTLDLLAPASGNEINPVFRLVGLTPSGVKLEIARLATIIKVV